MRGKRGTKGTMERLLPYLWRCLKCGEMSISPHFHKCKDKASKKGKE